VQLQEGFQPAFYIFKGEILQEDYFKDTSIGTYMAMQEKDCMTTFLFKEFLNFPRGQFLMKSF
jgi:hypothetical protein